MPINSFFLMNLAKFSLPYTETYCGKNIFKQCSFGLRRFKDSEKTVKLHKIKSLVYWIRNTAKSYFVITYVFSSSMNKNITKNMLSIKWRANPGFIKGNFIFQANEGA